MLIVAIAWIYVVGMAAIAEALSTQGTVMGALFTFLFYGVLPLSIVLYLLATPARKKALRRAEAAAAPPAGASPRASATGVDPDGGGHAPRGPAPAAAVPPEREET